jgi:starch synthase (maltosyl-transferring)
MQKTEGRKRVIIEGVKPEIDGGRFPVKRTVGESLVVEADIFVDGHDILAGVLRYRAEAESPWREVRLEPLVNDRWRGVFTVSQLGRYVYTLQAWVDRFATWRHGLEKKVEAEQQVLVELQEGAGLLHEACQRVPRHEVKQLQTWAQTLRTASENNASQAIAIALSDALFRLMQQYPDRQWATTYGRDLAVVVDREKARFSTWYELFPRSCAEVPGRHGTFRDCEARLPYIAEMGFDVLYLPPIHPVGRSYRKGKNNTVTAMPGDVGSPWAIGAPEGGHKAVHPELGTLDDFRHLVAQAQAYGLEVALDIAFQCSPDHPYVREHPAWFCWRPDGTVQYAENPPKKYQDIYPFNFDSEDWQGLWEELKSVFLFWIQQGVRIFRVDNPHTKSLRFWAWCIGDIKKHHPDIIFLSEAFTRPKMMYNLAKLGFTQSYTYFTWRNTKWEITQYFTELSQTDVREFFRPNLWPNTPDILNEFLQLGGRPAFVIRLLLAATLGANYGIYGPAFELCEHVPREPGSEEYLDSEKYEIKQWSLDRGDNLKALIARVNRIRRENPALQYDWGLHFHTTDNDDLICYSKTSRDLENTVLVVVNLSPYYTHSGWIELDFDALGLEAEQTYQVHDLLSDARYLWRGTRNYIELNPHVIPAHIFRVRQRTRQERDFEYYL